jgi:putative hydrolase of HD superfamily
MTNKRNSLSIRDLAETNTHIVFCLLFNADQGKDLEEFFQSTAGKFQTNIGKAWASEIVSRRRKQH